VRQVYVTVMRSVFWIAVAPLGEQDMGLIDLVFSQAQRPVPGVAWQAQMILIGIEHLEHRLALILLGDRGAAVAQEFLRIGPYYLGVAVLAIFPMLIRLTPM
jgi:hypothetical protein